MANLQSRHAEAQASSAAADTAAEQAAAAQAAADAASELEAQRAPEAQEPPSRGLRNAGFGVLGVGAVGLLTFAISGSLALSSAGELEDTCAATMPDCSEDEIGPLETRMLAADIGLGIGLVAATAGVIMVILGSKGGSDDSRALVLPMIQRDGGGAAMNLRF